MITTTGSHDANDHPAVWAGADLFENEPTVPDAEELLALERRIRTSGDVAQLLMVVALGSFPIVAVYHIDLEPELKLTLDLGSILWVALASAALFCGLNGLRLVRTRRRLLSAQEPEAGPRALFE